MTTKSTKSQLSRHFLQSQAWQNFQESVGAECFRVETADFEFMAIKKATKLGNYLYCPYGPNVSGKASLKQALARLKTLAAEQNCFFIRIEPTYLFKESDLNSLQLQKTRELNPEHTLTLDLTQTQEELFANMPSRKLRYWRTHEKKNQIIHHTHNPEEIGKLTTLLERLGEKNAFIPQDPDYLKQQLTTDFTTLYTLDLTLEDGKTKTIAAAMVYDDADTRYYMHAATDPAYANLSAGTTLLIQMILDAKADGRATFDFWGMTTSEDPNHPWYAFTQYKKSFGGQQKDYSGDYDLVLSRPKYLAYRALRSVNRLKRKLSH